MTGEWQQLANCATTDPELFFTEDRGSYHRAARQICAVCPVAASCLQEALEEPEQFGMRAGTTPNERRRMKRDAA